LFFYVYSTSGKLRIYRLHTLQKVLQFTCT